MGELWTLSTLLRLPSRTKWFYDRKNRVETGTRDSSGDIAIPGRELQQGLLRNSIHHQPTAPLKISDVTLDAVGGENLPSAQEFVACGSASSPCSVSRDRSRVLQGAPLPSLNRQSLNHLDVGQQIRRQSVAFLKYSGLL